MHKGHHQAYTQYMYVHGNDMASQFAERQILSITTPPSELADTVWSLRSSPRPQLRLSNDILPGRVALGFSMGLPVRVEALQPFFAVPTLFAPSK